MSDRKRWTRRSLDKIAMCLECHLTIVHSATQVDRQLVE